MTLAYSLSNLFLTVALIEFLIFPFAYHVKSGGTWREHPMGWHLMVFMVSLALAMFVAAWRRFVGPVAEPIVTAMWATIAAAIGWRVELLLREPPSGETLEPDCPDEGDTVSQSTDRRDPA